MTIPDITTKRLHIRSIREDDKELIYRSFSESDEIVHSADLEEIINQSVWDEITSPGRICVLIFLAETQEFIGHISLKFSNSDYPELGINILKDHHNTGYGPEAITAFCNMCYETNKTDKMCVRISFNNYHSMHIFEKLGAVFTNDTTMLSENTIEFLKKRFPDSDLSDITKKDVKRYTLNLPIGN